MRGDKKLLIALGVFVLAVVMIAVPLAAQVARGPAREVEGGGVAGAVTGPGSSTDDAIATWNGTGGDTLQECPAICDSSGSVTLPAQQRLWLGPGSDTWIREGTSGNEIQFGFGGIGGLNMNPTFGSRFDQRRVALPQCSTIAADATSLDGKLSNCFTTSANTGATEIIDIANDTGANGQELIICGGSDTNSSTITDGGGGGKFHLPGGTMTLALNECIGIVLQANDDFVEMFRNSMPSGMGDVVGPASSTDLAIARWDLATGKLLQDSANGPFVPDAGGVDVDGKDFICDADGDSKIECVIDDSIRFSPGGSVTLTLTQTQITNAKDTNVNGFDLSGVDNMTHSGPPTNICGAGTVTVTWDNQQNQMINLNSSPCTVSFVAPDGPSYVVLRLIQDVTGNRTVVWPAAVQWQGGVAPTLSTTGSEIDWIFCWYDSTAGGTYNCLHLEGENLVMAVGDVTAAAVMTDHSIIRGDGGAKGVQDSGLIIDDTDNVTGPANFTITGDYAVQNLGQKYICDADQDTFITCDGDDTFTFRTGAAIQMQLATGLLFLTGGLRIDGGNEWQINESATVPSGTPTTGQGAYWFRTDGTPMATNDSGTDFEMNNLGDVTAAAVIADHACVRGDGGAKGVQSSSCSISDAGALSTATVTGTTSVTVTGSSTIDSSGVTIVAGDKLDIAATGWVEWIETTTAPCSGGAGTGCLWVDDTVPTTIVFRDDTGADITLGAGGDQITALVSFDANDAMFPATNPAEGGSRNAHATLDFDSATDQNVVFESLMPLDYEAGTISVDIHYVAAGVTVNDVVWNVAFERMDADSLDIDADSFAAVQAVTDTVPGTDGQISVATITFSQAQADGIVAGEAMRIKLTRDADNVNDDAAADAQVLRVALEQ